MADENVLKSLEESPYQTNPNFQKYLDDLKKLREDGAAKERALKNENQDLRLNKQIEKKEKDELIAANNDQISSAKKITAANKSDVHSLVSVAISESNAQWKEYYGKVCIEAKEKIEDIKKKYTQDKIDLEIQNTRKLATIQGLVDDKTNIDSVKTERKAQNVAYKSKKLELKNNKNEEISKIKDAKFNAYMEKYGYNGAVRFEKHSIIESLEFKYRHYAYTFKVGDYLLRNAIYFVILIFFLACVGMAPTLFSIKSIVSILGQSSTKVFYSLGVAGLILIAGTDLSIGRLTGASVSLVCMIMSQKIYALNSLSEGQGLPIDMTNLSFIPAMIIAILVSILVCVLFTSIAGFFTAKFKMHPFITTLSTQLVSFGLMMFLFSATPAFNMNMDWAKQIRGGNNINLIIFAAIAIVIIWFIWNKTKFGKYMYAVGGNAEAASVSGINVFWVTMGIFIMAGVLYGLGGFFEATRIAVGSPSTGSGTELDAIAACVVGGISFSGGVGKVSGAVVGTIIFTALTYCLTYCKIDVNLQFVFKGIIIMAAVCLDSLKFLKKK